MSVKYKIAAYIYPKELRMPTGISMLTLNVVQGAVQQSGKLNFACWPPADELEPNGMLSADLQLKGIPVTPLPGRRPKREALWLAAGWPAIDRYLPQDYWVYCSMETFVPARRCKRIVTVHHLEPVRVKALPCTRSAFKQWRQDFPPPQGNYDCGPDCGPVHLYFEANSRAL